MTPAEQNFWNAVYAAARAHATFNERRADHLAHAIAKEEADRAIDRVRASGGSVEPEEKR